MWQVERKKKQPGQGRKSTLTLSGKLKGTAKGKVVRTDATRAARRGADRELQTRPVRTCRRDSWTPEEQDKLKELHRAKLDTTVGQKARRMSIAHVYANIFDFEEECLWESRRLSGGEQNYTATDGTANNETANNGWDKGTLARIAEYLNITHSNKIRDVRVVLKRVHQCAAAGMEYDGEEVDAPIVHEAARKIASGSFEEQLVADWMEGGCGLDQTTYFINEHLTQCQKEPVGRSAVYNCWRRLSPHETVIQPRQQCGGEAWRLAGHNWVTQKLIRLAIPIPDGCHPDGWDPHGPLPDMFNPAKLTPLSIHQIVAFDEGERCCSAPYPSLSFLQNYSIVYLIHVHILLLALPQHPQHGTAALVVLPCAHDRPMLIVSTQKAGVRRSARPFVARQRSVSRSPRLQRQA